MINVLLQLLPVGLFDTDAGSVVRNSLEVEGQSMAEAASVITSMAQEQFPGTAIECLSDWERVFALLVPTGASEEERQAFAAAWGGMTGSLSIPHVKYLASLILGYEPVIRETYIVRVGPQNYGVVGEARIWDAGGSYLWHMDISPLLTDRDTYERSRLEYVIGIAKPAHTGVSIGFTGGFVVGVSQVGNDKLN